jgi:hypothetical protein
MHLNNVSVVYKMLDNSMHWHLLLNKCQNLTNSIEVIKNSMRRIQTIEIKEVESSNSWDQ